jgi:NAD-dependent deacetylase
MEREERNTAAPALQKAARLLSGGGRVAVLTGAGISAESGIPTFRGADGLWRNFRASDLATPEAFARDPKLVWEWYDWRRGLIGRARPNPGHETLARWEKTFADFHLITQNVDGLHPLAGSRKILELHGNIWKTRCTREGTIRENRQHPLAPLPPRCPECGSLLRPHIVWFGESLDPVVLDRAIAAVRACDVLLVVGTSALVHPAASLALLAAESGARLIEINPDETPLTPRADASLRGRAGDILPRIEGALRGRGD